VCWNHKAGLCENCAPDEHEELAAQQAQAVQEQIYQKTRETNYVQDLDFKNRTAVQQCTGCSAKLTPQNKFCPECGTPNPKAQQKEKFCSGCGAKMKGDQRFCAECGTRNE
jgi:rRNA maturation endonuclease Nob1